MAEVRKKLYDEIKENLRITGNNILYRLFEEYSDNEEALYRALREYNSGIYVDVNEGSCDDEEGEDKKEYIHYVYLSGVIIDYKNVGRIELCEEYNIKKNKIEYGINFIKKFPSPTEENFILWFTSEDERDREYDILRGKLKMCGVNIL